MQGMREGGGREGGRERSGAEQPGQAAVLPVPADDREGQPGGAERGPGECAVAGSGLPGGGGTAGPRHLAAPPQR